MTSLSLNPENPAFQPEWALENTTSTFFKCTRWKVDATNLVNCPFHYFCDDSYPGDYPPFVDILVIVFALALFLSTLIFTVSDISRIFRGCSSFVRSCSRRYWLPSGPIALPFLLLALAKGHRVNTIIQVSCIGPALVQLLQISALAFEIKADNDFKYTFLEVSTVSGVLHASLYMDAILLPYYTGLDALLSSKFSGECTTCVCRKEELKVGWRLGYLYRGWSVTMYCVVAALCSRLVCMFCCENKRRRNLVIKSVLETLSWILISVDCVHLMIRSPQCGLLEKGTVFGAMCVLLCLQVLRKVVLYMPCKVKLSASKSSQV